MSDDKKISLDTLQRRVTEVKELTNVLRDRMKEFIEMKPTESSAIIFIVGLIFGVLFGNALFKRRE